MVLEKYLKRISSQDIIKVRLKIAKIREYSLKLMTLFDVYKGLISSIH